MHKFLNWNTYSFTSKSLTALPQFLPVQFTRYVHQSKGTSYTREKKVNPNFKPRWRAPALMEFNRRRQRVQIDEILRDGKEKVVKRSQFSDWNYAAEISAFQSRVGEQFDEDKLIQSFKTRDYLEHLILQHGRTFGSETDGSLMESEGNYVVLFIGTSISN